jgi:tetratricopeptide (TPR) repeat protein
MESEDYRDHSTRGGLMTEKRPTLRDRIRVILGLRFIVKGRYDQALAVFDRAIELDAADAGAFAGRGHTYLAMGRYDQALADFNRALELDPDDEDYALAIASRGQTFRAMKR